MISKFGHYKIPKNMPDCTKCLLQSCNKLDYKREQMSGDVITCSSSRRCLVYENTTGYLKNHWTKHRLACIHFDAFFMLMASMITNIEQFRNF